MIVFLTVCYIVLLALLVKLKVIRLNLWWKISPLVWIVLLLVVLFIPMQWGAPAGTVQVYQFVVEVIPNVAGEVIEVPVEPLAPLKKGDVLFRIDPRPYQDQVDSLEAQLKLAKINLGRAKELLRKKVGPQVDVDRYTAEVEQLSAELDKARYDLEQTVVRAPGDGFVLGVTLKPGQRVANLPLRSWMSFVNTDLNRVAIGINQYQIRHLRAGLPAEVTFKVLPGKTFSAVMIDGAPITPGGQLAPSGHVPAAPNAQTPPQPYGVLLKLEESFEEAGLKPMDIASVPGGAVGTGAIYTDNVKTTHIIRKVMLRMQAWLNYLIPY
ncbi:MAG: biotin/lipoyl-binding protein [Pseudomonadota bacterium]|nr:biotin/lipoyl-binding protein [Pseudomonadota bacterium]